MFRRKPKTQLQTVQPPPKLSMTQVMEPIVLGAGDYVDNAVYQAHMNGGVVPHDSLIDRVNGLELIVQQGVDSIVLSESAGLPQQANLKANYLRSQIGLSIASAVGLPVGRIHISPDQEIEYPLSEARMGRTFIRDPNKVWPYLYESSLPILMRPESEKRFWSDGRSIHGKTRDNYSLQFGLFAEVDFEKAQEFVDMPDNSMRFGMLMQGLFPGTPRTVFVEVGNFTYATGAESHVITREDQNAYDGFRKNVGQVQSYLSVWRNNGTLANGDIGINSITIPNEFQEKVTLPTRWASNRAKSHPDPIVVYKFGNNTIGYAWNK